MRLFWKYIVQFPPIAFERRNLREEGEDWETTTTQLSTNYLWGAWALHTTTLLIPLFFPAAQVLNLLLLTILLITAGLVFVAIISIILLHGDGGWGGGGQGRLLLGGLGGSCFWFWLGSEKQTVQYGARRQSQRRVL